MILRKDKKTIIGAIHLPPTTVVNDTIYLEKARGNALSDLASFEGGGIDAVIFENNYDTPHVEFISEYSKDFMFDIGRSLKENAKVPLGISVLWNDYKTALDIAKKLGLEFVRIPAFVDTVETSYGIMKACADEATAYRKAVSAHSVAILADIHVKHSRLLSPYSLEQSARLAINKDANALIVTGTWTGKAPRNEDLMRVHKTAGQFPIIIGSGLTAENAGTLMALADGAIVSTSLKDGLPTDNETNVKSYDQRISQQRVATLMSRVRRIA